MTSGKNKPKIAKPTSAKRNIFYYSDGNGRDSYITLDKNFNYLIKNIK